MSQQTTEQANTLTKQFIGSVMFISISPFLLNLLGITFGVTGISPDFSAASRWQPHELQDALHHALAGSLIHSLLEWSAVCAAMFTVVMAFIHFHIKRDAVTPILALALFCAGITDAFHVLASDRLIRAVADNRQFIPFTWAISRVFNAVIIIFGIGIFLAKNRSKKPEGQIPELRFVLFVGFLFALLCYTIIHICATSHRLPQTMYPNALIHRPWDIVPLILFAFEGIFLLPAFHRKRPSLFSHALIISMIPSIMTQLHMAFGSTSLFDNHFNIAHFLKVVAYLVPLSGLLLDYRGLQQANKNLGKEVSQRQRTQIVLEDTLSLLTATLESTTDGILVVSQEGEITRYNRKFVDMWQIPQSVISSMDDGAMIDFVLTQLKDTDIFVKKVRELCADPAAESFDVLESKDGRIFERYSKPQQINGVNVGRVWSFRDVSERKKLESMLIQSEKLSAVGQLAAGVAHEINNPLGIILGFAQSAAKTIQASDALALPVKSIEREALRCKNLVQNLLAFSRQGKAKMEEFDLNEVVTGTLSIIEAQARVKFVDTVKELGALPSLIGDKNQLQQVIVNLCNNAIDAMPDGGKITLRTLKGAERAILEVEDTGTGIPKEIQDKIFTPFFTTKEVGKGTGLGLSLVYEIIQRHKGTIEVRSEIGKGTAFIISLPMECNVSGNRIPSVLT